MKSYKFLSILILLLALFCIGFFYLYQFGQSSSSENTVGGETEDVSSQLPSVTASEVSYNIIEFINNSPSSTDLNLLPTSISCNAISGECQERVVTGGLLRSSFITISLKQSLNTAYQDRADSMMNMVLEKCKIDFYYCEFNLPSLYYYYINSGDSRYRDAMLTTSESVLQTKALADYVIQDTGVKLWYLYEVTKDERYKNRIIEIGNEIVTNNYSEVLPGNPELYKVGSYSVVQGMAETVWSIMIPSYRVSGESKYLDYANVFLDSAKFEDNVDNIWTLDRGSTLLAKVASTFLTLEQLDVTRSKEHHTRAKKLLEGSLYFWDTPNAKIINADYGLFTSYLDKNLNINAWYANLFSELGDEQPELSLKKN